MDQQKMEDKLELGRKTKLDKEGMKVLALELSIVKWEDLVKNPRGSPCTSENCALCKIYGDPERWCNGCPVRKETTVPDCEGTPFELFWDLVNDPKTPDKELSNVAQQEVDFLKSLRPKIKEDD